MALATGLRADKSIFYPARVLLEYEPMRRELTAAGQCNYPDMQGRLLVRAAPSLSPPRSLPPAR